MESKFDFSKREDEIYKEWEEGGYFACTKDASKKPFVVAMPPPNITGKLHMGHALDNTIQDIFVRYNRMKQVPTLWVPGTDHASIATEVKVVEKLKKEGKTKDSVGRDKFIEEVWNWKNEYGSEITKQLRKIGSSCDWKKEKFTMDENCSRAVLTVFENLYNQGLIYKGERLVNWCPTCKTSISDIEVEYEEEPSYLWHIKYKVKDSDEYVVVATTRPETMLGDTAVAVNPKDERYSHLVSKEVLLPIVNKYIPVVADRYVDMEFGTGVVKITPAHDKNDFEVGKRHNLEVINLLNEDGTLNDNALEYKGMKLEEARQLIVERLKNEGYLVKEEKYSHNVGKCYRCHNTIEPYMSNQWFVKMESLAKPAIDAVKNGEVTFIPKRFEKNFFNWMENIEDWCISRQLWWGHRIPAYYCEKCGKTIVSKDKITLCDECGGALHQDEDTLDTWFSSALWPFSIFGWPEETEDYKYFYPISTLVTGYDIIPFWVSKMIFSGVAYTGKAPFKNTYIHGLVRDAKGRKMSKSLGNGVNPLDVISEYGADALRFSLVQNISAGNDIRYIPEKVEASRNFTNKLWNAAKFSTMYLNDLDVESVDNLCPEDKWILTKLSQVEKQVTENIDKFEIGVVVAILYDFVWSDICDSYIEMIKPRLYNKNLPTYKAAIWTLNKVLVSTVKLLHPYIPFITEEIYSNLKHEPGKLINAKWPCDEFKYNEETKTVNDILDIIKNIRNIRATNDIQNSQKLNIEVYIKSNETTNIFKECEMFFSKMCSIEKICYLENEDNIEGNYISVIIGNIHVYVDMSNSINIEAKIQKLKEEKSKAESELIRATKMLENKAFVEKAPEALVNNEKQKQSKYKELLENIDKELNELLNLK